MKTDKEIKKLKKLFDKKRLEFSRDKHTGSQIEELRLISDKINAWSEGTYSNPEWNSEKTRFRCVKNGFGDWWPCMFMVNAMGYEYPVIIRDSSPFKTLDRAIQFIEKTIERIQRRAK